MIDFSIDKNGVVKNSDVDLIYQQIEILFDTHPKEVLGFEDFGTRYDDYLYKLNLSNESIRQQVLNDLYSLELFGFRPEVEVYLMQGTERDIALIKIELMRNNEKYEQIYKIS